MSALPPKSRCTAKQPARELVYLSEGKHTHGRGLRQHLNAPYKYHIAPRQELVYHAPMTDDLDPLVRKSVSLRRSMWEEIEAYRASERLGSEAETVRRLLVEQLKKAMPPRSKKDKL